MTQALILFDIDGTLMITRGAGSRCLHRAGQAVLGERFQWRPVTSGLLDPQLFHQLAQHNGIDPPATLHDAFRDCYLRELEAELQRIGDDIIVLPGVRDLLAALHDRAGQRSDVTLGLLSGNYRTAAQLKLAAAGIDWSLFPITVLAEDGGERNDLPAAAMRQHQLLHGKPVSPRHVVVIGDTPRDVACAAAHGCQVIAVATGRYSVEDLHTAGARHVLTDLAQPQTLDLVLRCAGLEAGASAADERQSSANR
ncbi:MAG: HAD family hydrolase [Phycisphaeraceae bacterium]